MQNLFVRVLTCVLCPGACDTGNKKRTLGFHTGAGDACLRFYLFCADDSLF